MDGKTGAEDLVGKMLKDPALLQTLGSAPKPKPEKAEEAPPAEETTPTTEE
jgi:type VI secretion system protein ImpB